MTERPPPLAATQALFLDFDGTVADFTETPDAVRRDAALVQLLGELQARHGGALAMVTGRPLHEVDALLAPLRLAAGAQHGAEMRLAANASTVRPYTAEALDSAREILARAVASEPRLLLEDKAIGLALHYRRAPALEATCRSAVEAAARTLPGYEMLAGKFVFELRPAGVDKGRAIDALMQQPPFAGRAPVFVGDDVTDEDGFAVVRRHSGVAVKVGDGTTNATHRLADVAAVRAWLAMALG